MGECRPQFARSNTSEDVSKQHARLIHSRVSFMAWLDPFGVSRCVSLATRGTPRTLGADSRTIEGMTSRKFRWVMAPSRSKRRRAIDDARESGCTGTRSKRSGDKSRATARPFSSPLLPDDVDCLHKPGFDG